MCVGKKMNNSTDFYGIQKKNIKPTNTFILLNVYVLINMCTSMQCKVQSSDENPIVETSIGKIKGLRAIGGDYDMFLGVPYATVNQSNIFGTSIPHPPFAEVFEAFDDSIICAQQEEFNHTITGYLDCLNLNVYVPNTNDTKNLPVMVYIFGGEFKLGFASEFLYGPDFLVRYGVILVTINYRLGPFGFMCLDIPEVPGNAGFKDQALALRWIHDHIKSFGGDPNQVTLFGNSAGGVSVDLHVISEYEKKFNNIIIQSGTALYPGVVTETDNTIPFNLAQYLGLATKDIYEALVFLSEVNIYAVIKASLDLEMVFGPCIEKEFNGGERFLARTGVSSNHSKVADLGVLIGVNSREMIVKFTNKKWWPEHWQVWEESIKTTLLDEFNFNETVLKEATEFVRSFYVGDEVIDINVVDNMVDFLSDTRFIYPSLQTIRAYLKSCTEKVYQYVFSYDGNRNYVKYRENITQPGAAHADELGYLFKMKFMSKPPTPEDQLITDRITTMWTNFAKYRDPTPQTNDLLPIKWNPITEGSPYNYINIDTEMSTGRRYAYDRMAFWDLFYKTYAKYEKGYIDPSFKKDESVKESLSDSSTILSLNTQLLIIVFIVTVLY